MEKKFKQLPKIIVICGPTASGKSDLAVWLAKKINGEIISADSRQVYKGLNIGTGKITRKEMKNVPHHLLNIASPNKMFSVAKYQALAKNKINEIVSAGKVPIICGGTGFYIDSIIKNLVLPEVPPNKTLRKKLNNLNNLDLFKKLNNLDKERAKSIDKDNKVRLIRAIEISTALGKVPKLKISTIYRTIQFGVSWSNEVLKKRIKDRMLQRIKSGMINEAKKLNNQGLSWKRMRELGLEYRYLSLFLNKRISKKEMVEKLNNEIWRYAKRQMTWFKREKDIIWVLPKEKNKILKLSKEFLS